MNEIKKGCDCCDELSNDAKSVLNEISSLLDPNAGQNINATEQDDDTCIKAFAKKALPAVENPNDKDRVLKLLDTINATLGGAIGDVVNLTKEVFSIDFASLDTSKIQATAASAKNLSDNPTIDVSKVLPSLDTSKMKDVKISLTVPAITLNKSIKMGPVSVNLRFAISTKEVSWGPAVDTNFNTPEKALAALKNEKIKSLLTPSSGKSLKELKDAAKKEIKDIAILTELLAAATAEEFFSILEREGINLYIEENLGAIAEKIYKDNLKAANAIKKKLKGEVGDSLVKELKEVGKMDLCGKRPSKTKKFSTDEVEEAIPCVVPIEPEVPLGNIQDIQDLINGLDLPNPEDELKKTENMLACVKKAQDIMNECGKKKVNAISRYYAFKEVALLHDLNHIYISERATAKNLLNPPFVAIAKEKASINSQLADVNAKLALTNLSDVERANLTAQKNSFNESLNSLQENYQSSVDSFQAGLEAEIKDEFNITGFNTYDFENYVEKARKKVKRSTNSISNLTGFKDNGKSLEMIITNPAIKGRLDTLLVQSLNGAEDTIFDSYLKVENYTFISGEGSPRTGFLENGLWKKYYSPNRIDDLFTWQEQGYTSPKPQYDSQGNALGTKSTVEIKSGDGSTIVQEVPTSVKECNVDLSVAVPFIEKLEELTRGKINSLATQILSSSNAEPYIQKIKFYARLEAKLSFYDMLGSTGFSNISVSNFETFNPDKFVNELTISQKFLKKLQLELNGLVKIIEESNDCIEKQKAAITECAQKAGGGKESPGTEKKCKDLLGSDPLGLKGSNGCPDYKKNCYWREYTKIMQTVSLMPIPDLQFLNKRLFRYYPVALQIPVPAAIPTLAMGIPDPVISIPMPFLWVHLLTLSTPVGTFVFWIGAAGGIIPNVYVMLIDEKQQAIFAVTLTGPSKIPDPALGITDFDNKSLLELLPGLDTTLRINLTQFPGNLFSGSTRLDVNKPDSSKTVIDNIKGKIKKSVDELVIPDPPIFGGNTPTALQVKDLIKNALKFTDCNNAEAIKLALKAVIDLLIASLDGLDVPGIKIPRDSTGMMMELPNAIAMLDTVNSLISTLKTAPGEAQKLLKEIGLAINNPLDVTAKLKELVRANTAATTSIGIFAEFDAKIDELEAELDLGNPEEAAKKRLDLVKELLRKQIEDAIKKITPEKLGFVSVADILPVLPEPCYTNVPIPPLPPGIALALETIKNIPNIILGLADDLILRALSAIIDFAVQLPSAEELFQLGVNLFLDLLPPLVIPIDISVSLLKEIKKALQNFIKTFTVRLPKVGLPIQIEIPGQKILAIIKNAIKDFLSALKDFADCYINQICNNLGSPDVASKIAAILNIIKLLFSVNLDQIAGPDIKAFLFSLLETIAFPALDVLGSLIDAASNLKSPFLSIISQFVSPDPPKPEGPFLELNPKFIKDYVDPIVKGAATFTSENIPFPVILLGCAFPATRAVLTKIHPSKPKEILPAWEGLSTKNFPFIIWLDQLVATAQRNALLGNSYVAPYFA
jgi:hypothetical protein